MKKQMVMFDDFDRGIHELDDSLDRLQHHENLGDEYWAVTCNAGSFQKHGRYEGQDPLRGMFIEINALIRGW